MSTTGEIRRATYLANNSLVAQTGLRKNSEFVSESPVTLGNTHMQRGLHVPNRQTKAPSVLNAIMASLSSELPGKIFLSLAVFC